MLRSRDKLTGEQKPRQIKDNEKLPDPTEGDCRECAFYTPPVSTGQSEDWRYITDNWRMRPCGQGRCIGKKFMTREDLKELQDNKSEKKKDKGKGGAPDPGKE